VFQVFELTFPQHSVQVFHRIHAGEPELKGPQVIFLESGFPPVVVKSIAAAFFENEQHDAPNYKFRQRIFFALARVVEPGDFFFQPRKTGLDGFGNLVSYLFAITLIFCTFPLKNIWWTN